MELSCVVRVSVQQIRTTLVKVHSEGIQKDCFHQSFFLLKPNSLENTIKNIAKLIMIFRTPITSQGRYAWTPFPCHRCHTQNAAQPRWSNERKAAGHHREGGKPSAANRRWPVLCGLWCQPLGLRRVHPVLGHHPHLEGRGGQHGRSQRGQSHIPAAATTRRTVPCDGLG